MRHTHLDLNEANVKRLRDFVCIEELLSNYGWKLMMGSLVASSCEIGMTKKVNFLAQSPE